MEYNYYKLVKRSAVAEQLTTKLNSPDILSINPNIIPKYARLINRYQRLIRKYDILNGAQQKNVQTDINNITQQLTQLLKRFVENTTEENSVQAIYLLCLMNSLEGTIAKHLNTTTLVD